MAYESMVFKNREEAGLLLAEKIGRYREQPVVFAISNNGMPVAAQVASALQAPLDMLVTREISGGVTTPLGALSPGDVVTIDRTVQHALNISDEELYTAILEEVTIIKEKMITFNSGVNIPSKITTAYIVDDGSASALAIRAAIETITIFHNPTTIIFASPICSMETNTFLKSFVTSIVCISHPRHLFAINNWYEDVQDVTDRKVMYYLAQAALKHKAHQENLQQGQKSEASLTSPFRYKFS